MPEGSVMNGEPHALAPNPSLAQLTAEPDQDQSQSPENFTAEMLGYVPGMRGFALSISGNSSTADDMVQDALIKAWEKRHLYQPGTNLRAWLFTILRNEYFSKLRKYRREIEDVDGLRAEGQITAPEQSRSIDVMFVAKALQKIPDAQREALILVGAGEFSYEEAAEIAGVKVGTIKSRVNRGRDALNKLMSFDDAISDDKSPEDLGLAEGTRNSV